MLTLPCPQCGNSLRIPDNLLIKKIQCPRCSAVFAPPAPMAEPVRPEVGGIRTTAASAREEPHLRSRRLERDVRRDPTEEAVAAFIPYRNPRALLAYYLSVFSLIPCVGNLLGPAAVILGFRGLRFVQAHPTAKGTGHAITGIILGGLTALWYWIFTAIGIFWLSTGGWSNLQSPSISASAPTNAPTLVVPAINQPPRDFDLRQPLFAADRDLLDANGKPNVPPEPGRVAVLRMGRRINALAFSGDGKTLAVATEMGVQIWDVAKGKSRTVQILAESLALSRDGKLLATGHPGLPLQRPSIIEIVDTQTTQEVTHLRHWTLGDKAERMAFAPDGKRFASTSGANFSIWDTTAWRVRVPELVIGPGLDAPGVTWLGMALLVDPQDPKTIAVTADQRVVFWDMEAMKEKFSLRREGIFGGALALSSDRRLLACGAAGGDIELWDVPQRKLLRRLPGHTLPVRSLAFSADGKVLISITTDDSTMRLWDVAAGKELAKRVADVPERRLFAFAASPDGKSLLTGSTGGLVKVWDLSVLRGKKPSRER